MPADCWLGTAPEQAAIDYHPDWDRDRTAIPWAASDAARAAPVLTPSTWDALNLPVPTVWAVRTRRRGILGHFVSGTNTAPHLLIVPRAIDAQVAATGHTRSYILQTTILHEGCHAYLESGGLPTEAHDQAIERIIEAAVEEAWAWDDPARMRASLDRALADIAAPTGA